MVFGVATQLCTFTKMHPTVPLEMGEFYVQIIPSQKPLELKVFSVAVLLILVTSLNFFIVIEVTVQFSLLANVETCNFGTC